MLNNGEEVEQVKTNLHNGRNATKYSLNENTLTDFSCIQKCIHDIISVIENESSVQKDNGNLGVFQVFNFMSFVYKYCCFFIFDSH